MWVEMDAFVGALFREDSRKPAALEECVIGFKWGAAYSQAHESADCKDSTEV